MLTLMISMTSSMLYKRHKHRFPTLHLPHSTTSPSSPSQSILMGKQLELHSKKCQAHPLVLELEPPRKLANLCSTATVGTYGCRGRCSSYSQLDPRNATNIIHSCSCCQPLRFMVSFTRLNCKNGLSIRVFFKTAIECSCRPCYAEEAPKDVIRFDELLSRPAVDTPLPIG